MHIKNLFNAKGMLACMALGLWAVGVEATTFDVGDLKYNTLSGNNVEVAGPATGVTVTDIVIPEQVTYSGTTYNVTQVKDRSFMDVTTLTSVKFHNGITSIGAYAFGWTSLQEVEIPNKVTDLPRGVFYNCQLKKVIIPNSVVSLGLGAFASNRQLAEVQMSNNLRTMGGEAFLGDISLKELVLPATITSLAYDALGGCTSMTKLTCLAAVPPTSSGGNPFGQNANFQPLNQEKCVLVVPASSIEAYQEAEYWKAFTHIEAQKFDGCGLMISNRIGAEMVQTGQPFSLQFRVSNAGTEAVNSVECTYSIAGNTGKTSYTFPTPVASGEEGTMVLDFPAVTTEGAYELTLAPVTANGKPNATPDAMVFKVRVGTVLQLPADAVSFTYAKEYTGNYFGLFASYNWSVAMKLNDPSLVGMKVVGMKVDHLSPESSQTAGWLSTNLSGTPDLQVIETDPYDNAFTVVFPTPYEVTSKGVYVGYNVTAERVNLSDPADVPGSCYLTYATGALSDYSSYGAACITVYLTGDFKADCVSVSAYDGNPLVLTNETLPVNIKVQNQGNTAVNQIGYEYTINSKTVQGTADVNLSTQLGAEANVPLQLEALPNAGYYPFNFTVTTVNGKPNTNTNNKLTVNLQAMSFKAVNRPLLEEATGTWCGWCTRGWRAMELLNEKLPDFVGLAWHNRDPMTVTNSFPFIHDGFPSAAINRVINKLDPYGGNSGVGFGMYDLYTSVAKEVVPADISLATQWNSDKTALNVTTTVHFAGDFNNYKIGYVLATNGLRNASSDHWNQANYYSGGDYTGDLAILAEMEDPIVGLTFNDVAIGVNDAKGVANSLPARAERDQTYTHQYTIPTTSIRGIVEYEQEIDGNLEETGYELIQNKDNLFVVALLLRSTGEVMNSCKAKAGDASTGINDVIVSEGAQAESVRYYDMMGRLTTPDAHGLVIRVTRDANGNTTATKQLR